MGAWGPCDGGAVPSPGTESSFVERKEGVGVIYRLGFSHFCGEKPVLCKSPWSLKLRVRLRREDPQAPITPQREGVAPSQLCLSFPACFGAASLGVKGLGRGEGIGVSELHPQPDVLGALLPSVQMSLRFSF